MADAPHNAEVPTPVATATLEGRREQMFPRLDDSEVKRIVRFGDSRAYRTGEYLAKVGNPGLGLFVILCGTVAITQRQTKDPMMRVG